MTDEDMFQFNNDFKCDINLISAKYGSNGIKEYSYKFYHQKIVEYRDSISLWLKSHNISHGLLILYSNISIKDCEDLSIGLIHEFERNFDVTYGGYEISCNSRNKTYNFY